jgi:hypothetical protein
MNDELELIPRSVRDKLDRIGVKLHLRDWQRLSIAERQVLRDQPCAADADAARYRADLERMVRARTGHGLEPLPAPASRAEGSA